MSVYQSQAVVIGRRVLGESDRLVEFYTRDFGKLRGVAKSARRPRSRFGSSLELFTFGEVIFFDSGRSELVRIDRRLQPQQPQGATTLAGSKRSPESAARTT